MFVSENVAVTASDASQPRALPPARGMGVLAFGDSSTWALERDGSTGRGASAKARRAARFGDGKLPRREDDDADGTARAGVTPRNAWPEGTFTITYPRGYDPARGRFVRGGEGDAEARVRVEKAPARARREAEAASRAEIDEAARAAAAALRLDEAYLERVRAQRREATRRRDERKKRLPIRDEATTSRTEMRSVAARGVDVATAASPNASRIIGEQKKKHAPEDEAYAALYARRAAERDAARARVAAGRAAAAKRDAASAGIRGGNNGKRKKKRREDT